MMAEPGNSSLHTHINPKTPYVNPIVVAVLAVQCTGMLLALILNSLHVCILRRSQGLFTGNLRLCLRILAVVDMCGGVVCYGSQMLFIARQKMFTSEMWVCNIAAGMCIASVLASQTTLLVITIDRYVAVTRPLRYYAILTGRRIRVILLVALLVALAVCVVRAVHSLLIEHCDFIGERLFKDNPDIAIYNTIPIVFTLGATTLNTHILIIARRQKKRDDIVRRQSLALQSEASASAPCAGNVAAAAAAAAACIEPRRSFSTEYKSAIAISAVVAASYLVWTPYLVSTILFVATDVDFHVVAKFAVYWVVYTTFWLNPIILGLVNKRYRDSAACLCRRRASFRKRRHVEDQLAT